MFVDVEDVVDAVNTEHVLKTTAYNNMASLQ